MNALFSFLLCISSIFCLNYDLIFEKGETETFWEQLESNDYQLTVELSVTSPENAALRYRIIEPNSSKRFATYQDVSARSAPAKFTGKGLYAIEIFNFDSKPVLFSLSTYVDKEVEVDENTTYIKNILEKLKLDLRNLYNSSMQLSVDKRNIIRDARKSRTKLIWLCILPLGYVAVGIVKYRMMKSMFTPKKR
ncbi:hypothetical protein THOM_1784 [Trachipleistophora hominis]|uniref:GOLD domain-containing protein n=1 Tax=Trachipleistophora hominis TaxID=72359 RepID=L7JX30_TRAHO|nr:hypothetical protein THOM_1784 [Trachipleistophora hominis]